MADLTITAANVVAVDDSANPIKKRTGISGVAITAGECIYEREDGDGVKRLYKADNAALDTALAKGIALDSAPGVNQPVVYAYDGKIDLGATLTPGQVYMVSNTAGKICPSADIASVGEFITLLGMAVAANRLILITKPTGEAIT